MVILNFLQNLQSVREDMGMLKQCVSFDFMFTESYQNIYIFHENDPHFLKLMSSFQKFKVGYTSKKQLHLNFGFFFFCHVPVFAER